MGYQEMIGNDLKSYFDSTDSHRGVFVTDLDGTLLNDSRKISQNDLATLRILQDQSIIPIIATGRSYFSFNKLIEGLDFAGNTLAVNYVIFSTGAGVMTFPERRIIKSFALNHSDVIRVSDFLDHQNIDYMVQKPVPETNHFIYSRRKEYNPDFERRIDLYRGFAAESTRKALLDFGDATQVLCIVPQDSGHAVAEDVAQQFPDLSVVKATSPLDNESVWIEIFSPEVSKSKAVEWLALQLGLSSKQVCAVGNDYNDEDLLDWAGTSFITSNGPKKLRLRHEIVASNNEEGVTEAAQNWLLL